MPTLNLPDIPIGEIEWLGDLADWFEQVTDPGSPNLAEVGHPELYALTLTRKEAEQTAQALRKVGVSELGQFR